MKPFLLLHGAWHGAWVWDQVVNILRQQEHRVIAPDLPGLGSRQLDPHESIDLQCHIDAVIPAESVILVAHSYAGMIARSLCHHYPQRVAGVILIEALWPEQGQCVLDLVPQDARRKLLAQADTDGNAISIPPPPAAQFHIQSSALQQQVNERLQPQPLQTYTEAIRLSGPIARATSLQGTYVISSDREPQPYAETAAKLQREGWNVVSTPGGHSTMLTQPDFIANLLHASNTGDTQCDAN